jgi:hypothetical protein
VNERDIAPRAWMPRDLRQIPALFQRDPERRHAHDAVETLLQLFGELDYEQIGNKVQTRPSLLHSDLLFDEIIYQHLDAYFEQLGLEAEMSTSTFFTPLALSDLSPQ